MTSWFIDPSFDPLQELQDCRERSELALTNTHQLAAAFNDQSEMIKILSEQNRSLITMISKANLEIVDLIQQVEELRKSK